MRPKIRRIAIENGKDFIITQNEVKEIIEKEG